MKLHANVTSSFRNRSSILTLKRVSRALKKLTKRTSMSLKTGIVGLPNVGKSTLFNALTENAAAQTANFPFCTIEPNVGLVAVPDERLQVLSQISSSENIIPAFVEIVDIAGLVKGASEGQGLGNKFLSNIRECDAIIHTVRCFDDDEVIHVDGRVNPVEDVATINFELALSDLLQVERRIDKLKKGKAKSPTEKAQEAIELEVLKRISLSLESGIPVRVLKLSEEESLLLSTLNLLTQKPCIYAANVCESDLRTKGNGNIYLESLLDLASSEGSAVCIVSAKIESELVQMELEEREFFLEELGVKEVGLPALVRAVYKQLKLQTYFTTGEKETRAWTTKIGATAPQAAGVIHTDFERGFIKAETVSYEDYVASEGIAKAKEKGLWRLEGKEYVVKEGDVMVFKFNV
mmetsp:Transcript_3468/g.10657  ORF Transcript_3468/g.10657 Transcript_3468/m.10657 type:complete len:407 (+) Transcript_3468:107-1327(+)